MLLRWLIFIHVLSVITFFLAHGTSVAMAFQLRKETNIERIRAMLELSSTTLMMLFVSFLVMGLTGPNHSVAELELAGVKRISVGGSFARAALGAFVRAAKEVRDQGTFGYAVDAIPDAEAATFMAAGKR